MGNPKQYTWKNGRNRWIRGFAPYFLLDGVTLFYIGNNLGRIEKVEKGKYYLTYFDGKEAPFTGSHDSAIKELFEYKYKSN